MDGPPYGYIRSPNRYVSLAVRQLADPSATLRDLMLAGRNEK